MKRIITKLVLVVYSAANIGATVHLHYCMNEFTGWDLRQNDKDKTCGICGMKEKEGGCCKDEHKQIKIEDDQQKRTFDHIKQVIATPVIISAFPSFTHGEFGLPHFIPAFNAPPHIPKRLHRLYSVFLI